MLMLVLFIVTVGLYCLKMLPVIRCFFDDPKQLATQTTKVELDEQLEEKWIQALKDTGCTGKQYLVIGVGFVGAKLVKALLKRGETRIRTFDLMLCNDFIGNNLVDQIRGDVSDSKALNKALEGVDVVYSTFAIIRFWESLPHQYAVSHSVNVIGTENVLKGCQEKGVEILIQTSTSNVAVPNNNQPVIYYSESSPYVTKENAFNHYGFTKAIAERMVLDANGCATSNGRVLRTAAVRPCSAIFGARDRFILQPTLQTRRVESMTFIPPIDYVHVDNVVYGHLLMEKQMHQQPDYGGKAVCIGNDDPISLSQLRLVLADHSPGISNIFLPLQLILLLATFVSFVKQVLKHRAPHLGPLETLTLTTVGFSRVSHILRSQVAKNELGYEPFFTLTDGVKRSIVEFNRGQLL